MKFCSINNLKESAWTFLSKEKHVDKFIHNFKSSGIKTLNVIISHEIEECLYRAKLGIELQIEKNPKLAFIKLINENYIQPYRKMEAGVCMYGDISIGNNVNIYHGTIIGKPGFGYEWDEGNQQWINFPHIGSVIIGNNVEIGANVCIDRGTLDNTIIGNGTKIDNLVHIAHNVIIGKNCMLVCHCGIGGSVEIGDNCWIGMGAQIRNGLKIGNNVTVGMGAIVVKNVPDGITVIGNPAKELTDKR